MIAKAGAKAADKVANLAALSPEQMREMQAFRDGLKSGDKVITAGGIYAVVKKVEETTLLIEVDSNVTLRVDKNMVVAAPAPQQK
jgi:preprotein translocase subunit YajC